MAELCGVSTKGARRWLEAEAYPDTGRIIEIAEKLNINVEWLMAGIGQIQSPTLLAKLPNVNFPQLEWKKIPLISWDKVADFANDPHLFSADQFVQAMVSKDHTYYALSITDKTISGVANSKSFLIVSTTIKPIHQCKVIAKWFGSMQTSCYIYLEDFPHHFLKQLWNDYPPIQIDTVNRPVEIYGVVSQFYTIDVF